MKGKLSIEDVFKTLAKPFPDACLETTKENYNAVLRIARDIFLKAKSTQELLKIL